MKYHISGATSIFLYFSEVRSALLEIILDRNLIKWGLPTIDLLATEDNVLHFLVGGSDACHTGIPRRNECLLHFISSICCQIKVFWLGSWHLQLAWTLNSKKTEGWLQIIHILYSYIGTQSRRGGVFSHEIFLCSQTLTICLLIEGSTLTTVPGRIPVTQGNCSLCEKAWHVRKYTSEIIKLLPNLIWRLLHSSWFESTFKIQCSKEDVIDR